MNGCKCMNLINIFFTDSDRFLKHISLFAGNKEMRSVCWSVRQKVLGEFVCFIYLAQNMDSYKVNLYFSFLFGVAKSKICN